MRMSNFSSIYLDGDDDGGGDIDGDGDDDDGKINNVSTVNSVLCTGHCAKHLLYLITFSFHGTLKDGNHCFILQIKLSLRKATEFAEYHKLGSG